MSLRMIMAITDRGLMGEDPVATAERLIEDLGPAVVLQVRENDLCDVDLAAWMLRLGPVASRCGALLTINRRLDIARACRVGVHLPEQGIDVRSAKRLLEGVGPVGASRHSVEGVRCAAAGGADFVTISPIFASPNKGPPLGSEILDSALASVGSETRLFALGGIDHTNAARVWESGVHGIAAIRAVWCDDPRRLLEV